MIDKGEGELPAVSYTRGAHRFLGVFFFFFFLPIPPAAEVVLDNS